jgi:release factor glutamine methyltransferase
LPPPPAGELDIAGALAWARTHIDQMDARVLLRHVLQCPAARLVAWPEHKLAGEDWTEYRGLVERRAAGEPVAYLTGTREFYGREFMVTPAVLIPRPETELLVELALAHFPGRRGVRALDLGTGSGALAVTLALEMDAGRGDCARSLARGAVGGDGQRREAGRERVLRAERLVRRARRASASS